MHRTLLSLAAICVLVAPATADPLAERPYLGLSARDTADGPVVGWISPGPLGGTGFSSRSGIRRSDNIVSINGEEITSAAEFSRIINALSPGDTITLVVRRSPQATPGSAVPQGGPGGEERTFSVELSDRLSWSGTVGRGLGEREIAPPAEGEFEAMILRHAEALDVLEADGGLRALKGHLHDVQERALDPNSLSAVVNMFRRPLSLDAVEQQIADLVFAGFGGHGASGETGEFLAAPGDDWPWTIIAGVLDLPQIADEATDAGNRVDALERIASLADQWRPAAQQLVRTMRRGVYLHDEHAGQSLALIRESPDLVETILPVLAGEGRQRWRDMDAMIEEFRGRPPLPADDVPGELREHVEGDIVHYERIDGPAGGWLVVGGEGPNTYDMSKIAFVIDLGGDDVYRYRSHDHLSQVIIDLGGDDLHESTTDFAGAATGVFGISILDSRGGNDTFRSADEQGNHFTIGAGLLGIGILLNHGGDNRYLNLGPSSGWSTGAGFYGAGLVIDLDGDDEYHAELLSQGVGGPRGLGAIIDARGNDSYKANGPSFPSVYGTEGVFVSRSQGFGYGVRSYAAGGVGAIYDLDGDDRYEAGEFGQAGAYYFGLGIIRDRRGNDTYIGNRYGQAFAAHQAGGILIDEDGDDVYESMTAASQSGAWDQCITMLIDRRGNDTYTAHGLAQGSAAHQSIALLIDLDGNDTFQARGGNTQGASSNNTYHYHTSGVFSFSGLFALGEGERVFSSGRESTTRTGRLDEENPGNSRAWGVFVRE